MRFSRKGLEDLREASAKLGPQPRQHKSILGELRPRFHVGESGGPLGGGSGHRHRQHAHPGAAPVALRSVEHSPSAEEVRLHAQQQQQQQQEQEHDAESPWGGVQSHASSSHFSHASQSSVGTADFLTAEVRRRPRRGSSSLHAEALSDRGQGSSSWTVQHQQREQQHEHEQEDLDAPLSGQEDVASTLTATSAAITSHSGSFA